MCSQLTDNTEDNEAVVAAREREKGKRWEERFGWKRRRLWDENSCQSDIGCTENLAVAITDKVKKGWLVQRQGDRGT